MSEFLHFFHQLKHSFNSPKHHLMKEIRLKSILSLIKHPVVSLAIHHRPELRFRITNNIIHHVLVTGSQFPAFFEEIF